MSKCSYFYITCCFNPQSTYQTYRLDQEEKIMPENHTQDLSSKEKRTVNMLLPPPILLLILMLGASIIHAIVGRGIRFHWFSFFLGCLVLGSGVLLIWKSIRLFQKHGTSVRPLEPTTALVQRWPYSLSRNPMYIGMGLLLFSVSLLLRSPAFFFSVILFFIILHFGVVLREERYLLSLYGKEYEEYMKKVKRWI